MLALTSSLQESIYSAFKLKVYKFKYRTQEEKKYKIK